MIVILTADRALGLDVAESQFRKDSEIGRGFLFDEETFPFGGSSLPLSGEGGLRRSQLSAGGSERVGDNGQ